MPIDPADLKNFPHILVSGEDPVGRALDLLMRNDGYPWWHLVVDLEDGRFGAIQFAELGPLGEGQGAGFLYKPLGELVGAGIPEAVQLDRKAKGLRGARDLAYESPSRVVVVTDGGLCIGVVASYSMGATPGLAEFQQLRAAFEAETQEEMAMPPQPERPEVTEGDEESRHAQVRVQELGGPEGPRPEPPALVAGRDYAFDVRVAPPDPEWPGVREEFPDDEIDFSRGPVELTVVFSAPALCPEPLVDRIMLPATGKSTTCRFVVRAAAEIRAFQVRIAFVYRNRVLQTVLVTGQVVARAEDRAEVEDNTIDRRVEAVVGPGFDYLAGRRRFDTAVVLNHTADGRRLAMALADDRASWVSTEKFQATVDIIRKKLTDMSLAIQDDEKLYASLAAPETNDLLLDLAINGAELYQGLVEDWGLDDLKSARRVQIVATDFDRFFPLEFLYDREVPDDDARLCLTELQALEKALRAGRCDKACPEKMRKVICPLGFWCLRCIIERHTFDPKAVPRDRGDYALIPEGPTAGGAPLHPLRSAVFGASQKVDNKVQGQRDQVMATLQGLVRSEAGRAETWGEWEETVKAVNPSLLLLIPHTVLQRSKNAMEIGRQARLIGARIRREHVRPTDAGPPPVVFLLGCDTGVDHVSFDSFVAGFRRARAALVVTTLSTVLGRHAAPIAQALLQELSGFRQAEPFGEATLAVRQKLFAQGMPAVLTLAVYGDADWLVEAEPS